MTLETLIVRNFRCFADAQFEFRPQFNLLIGDNGSGKTSVLEAIAVGVASWFLGIPGYDSKTMENGHVRVRPVSFGDTTLLERQYPVSIACSGQVMDQFVHWSREVNGPNGSTRHAGAATLKALATEVQAKVRAGEGVSLPLIAYYSTKRLWVNPREVDRADDNGPQEFRERFDGYRFSVDDRINVKELLTWLRRERYLALEAGADSLAFAAVKGAIVDCTDGCLHAEYSVKEQSMMLTFNGHDELPFHLLSDGQRSMVAMVADLARKAVTLNPHLGISAPRETKGVVMIDEIDLHLHPRWQRKVVESLKRTFPLLQFFATTHSPQVIGETPPDEILILKPDGTSSRPTASIGFSSNQVLRNLMSAPAMNAEMLGTFGAIFSLIENGEFREAREMINAIREKGTDFPELVEATTYMEGVERAASEIHTNE